MPAGQNPVTQFQPYAWVRRNIADVTGLHAVLDHKPELIADPAVANWSAARLPGLATDHVKQRITWRRNTRSEEELNRPDNRDPPIARPIVEDVFDQRNNFRPHYGIACMSTVTAIPLQCTLFPAPILGS